MHGVLPVHFTRRYPLVPPVQPRSNTSGNTVAGGFPDCCRSSYSGVLNSAVNTVSRESFGPLLGLAPHTSIVVTLVGSMPPRRIRHLYRLRRCPFGVSHWLPPAYHLTWASSYGLCDQKAAWTPIRMTVFSHAASFHRADQQAQTHPGAPSGRSL